MAKGFDTSWRDADPRTLGANRDTQAAATTPKRGNKFNARKTLVDGISFDSKHESEIWLELKMEQHAGAITGLQHHREFVLTVVDIRDGQLRRICEFTPDFVYYRNGVLEVKEAKGVRTRDYVIRRKLFEAQYGITVIEV